jgi:hypothetical protein
MSTQILRTDPLGLRYRARAHALAAPAAGQ